MARAFTQYWKDTPGNWDSDSGSLYHSASNAFRKRGVQPGDKLFIVTVSQGRLYLGGVLVVDKLMGMRDAKRRLGKDIWEANDHVTARDRQPFYNDLRVPLKTVQALRFEGDKALVFKTPGKLDQQTLRGIRELTAESASKLEDVLAAAAQQGPARREPVSLLGSNALSSMRNDTEATRVIFDSIFASAAPRNRKYWEEFLANAIDYAAARHPDRWALALHRNYLRFNVGMVLCIQFHPEHGVTLLLRKKSAPNGFRMLVRQYKYAPGCKVVLIPFATARAVIDRVRAANTAAIDICAAAHRGSGAFRNAHAPGALRYLEEALSRKLPNPSYAPDISRDPDAAVLRQGLVHLSHPFAKELGEEIAILGQPNLSVTEKTAIVMSRRGQGLFRKRVARLERRCRVTGVTDLKHLRASHIKPWRNATNVERVSENNGLMLAPHVDHLFDEGYIGFSDLGDLLVSPKCPRNILATWGISPTLNVGEFRTAQRPFLAEHRRLHGFQS